MPSSPTRWFVRGTSAPLSRGNEWHIEGPDVETMLCGVVIDVDDGAVLTRPVKNVCASCARVAKRRDKETAR